MLANFAAWGLREYRDITCLRVPTDLLNLLPLSLNYVTFSPTFSNFQSNSIVSNHFGLSFAHAKHQYSLKRVSGIHNPESNFDLDNRRFFIQEKYFLSIHSLLYGKMLLEEFLLSRFCKFVQLFEISLFESSACLKFNNGRGKCLKLYCFVTSIVN